jgi:hypothetical protein
MIATRQPREIAPPSLWNRLRTEGLPTIRCRTFDRVVETVEAFIKTGMTVFRTQAKRPGIEIDDKIPDGGPPPHFGAIPKGR